MTFADCLILHLTETRGRLRFIDGETEGYTVLAEEDVIDTLFDLLSLRQLRLVDADLTANAYQFRRVTADA